MSDTAKKIVEGMAYELWAQSLAGYCIDHPDDVKRRDEYEDLIRGKAEPPAAAMQPAMELANLYEIANDMTLAQILEHVRKNPWGDLDDAWLSSPFEVGYLLAGMAINHPWNWPAESKLEPVHIDISFTGAALVWDGDISPRTNPAKYDEVLREKYGDNTTIVIERGDHGYSAWLESNTGGRLPISFGRERPTNGREALSAAKRFLSGVHGKNNPAGGDNFPTTPPPTPGSTNAVNTVIRPHRVWAWIARDTPPGSVRVKEPGYVEYDTEKKNVYLDVNITAADARATKIPRAPDSYRVGETVTGVSFANDSDGEDIDGVIVDTGRTHIGTRFYVVRDDAGRDHKIPFGSVFERERRNPAGGPTRGGEQSRFRSTARGFGRTTAVIPRARGGADAPELSYDRWSVELGREAAKLGATIAFGGNTHDAWKAGKTPEQYARDLKRMGAAKARKLR